MGRRSNEVSSARSKMRTRAKKGYLIMSADRHVFNLLAVLGLSFLTLYLLGTSLPGWFLVEEYVNTSTCASANRYISDHVSSRKDGEYSKLYVSSSLWYLHIHLEKEGSSTSQFLPFVLLPKADGAGTHVLCSGILGIITFTLLALGILFTINASTKPSKMVYYGLSQVAIVTAGSTWMLVSFEASQNYVTSVARAFCLEYILLSTSLSLQILTGACAVLAFIMGCIMIHLATVLNSNVKYETYPNDYDVMSEPELLGDKEEDKDDDLLFDV